jgi:tRNA(Ile)-lysidine synthase
VEEILATGSGGSAMLPGGWIVSGNKAGWRFDPYPVGSGKAAAMGDYQYVLAVPGMVHVPEVGTRFEVVVVPVEALPGYNPDHLFDTALLQKELTVRNWRAGDRFWPAQRKSEKKVKELLQGRKLPEKERKLWPVVVVSGGEIVWVRGFPAPARWRPREGAKEALVIKEHSKT